MSKKFVHDLAIGVVILAGSVFLLHTSFSFPKSSAAFPQLLLAAIILMDVAMLVQSFLREKSKADSAGGEVAFNPAPYIVFAFIAAFVVLFRVAGYFVAAPLLLVGLMLYFKVRSWKVLVSVTSVFCLFIYVLFVMQFKLDLL